MNSENILHSKPVIDEIAAKYCGVKTLETQNSDDSDFHNISVWALKSALEAAFNAGYESLLVKFSSAAPQAIPDETAAANLIGLNYEQLEFMRTVGKFNRREIAEHLRRGVEVKVVKNNEVPESPPFALDVVEDPGFWIGCFDTDAQAREVAVRIGLSLRD